MKTLLGGLAGSLMLGLLGCQSPPPAAPRMTAVADTAAEAERAFASRDWPAAARLLREALARDPERLALHYRLAIAASHLDLGDEAVREFRWVFEKAPAGSEEAIVARQWLEDAGVLAAARSAEPNEATPGESGLSGQVAWDDPGPAPVSIKRMQLFLFGLPEGPARGKRYDLRTDEEGRFRFRRVVPGPYQLTNKAVGQPTWRLRVQIEPGQEQTLDLTAANSTRARDDFASPSR